MIATSGHRATTGKSTLRRVAFPWLLAALLASCAHPSHPVVPVPVPAPAPSPAAGNAPPAESSSPAAPPAVAITPDLNPVEQLQAELDKLFRAPAFDRMMWGIQVQSLETGEVLYRLNPSKLLMPASNMKIVTLSAAAERLGWDYTFETKIVPRGQVRSGTLHGDLIVIGNGDPTINGRGGNLTAVFEEWAAKLRSAGITAIEGRIIADDRLFEAETLGPGWSWDYLVYGYAAPVTALQYNENVAEVIVQAGNSESLPARIVVRPEGTGLSVVNHVVTTAVGTPPAIELRRMPGSDRLDVTGTIPVAASDMVRTIAVDNPARFFAQALKNVLVQSGIRVRGDGVAARSLTELPTIMEANPLFSHRSAPLSEIAKVLMRVSQNLYAETLLKSLGLQAGEGSVDAGRKVVKDVLDAWGVAPDSYVLIDGSGLSRYNYVTAEMLTQLLRHVYNDPRHRQPFLDTLPVAGVEGGTLSSRMRGTKAAGNVRAKTGSIANVRALSGFLQSADGEPLVFSIIANNFSSRQSVIDSTTDLALERLANFARKVK